MVYTSGDIPSAQSESPCSRAVDSRGEPAEDNAAQPRLLEREAAVVEVRSLLSKDWERAVGPIIVEGHAGIGKTAILGTACQMAREVGWHVLRARADKRSQDTRGGVIKQLVDSYAVDAFPDQLSDADVQPREGVDQLDHLVDRLAAEGGVLVAVDDADRLDELTASWLHDLVRRPVHQQTRVILSLAARSPQSPLRPAEPILSEPGTRVIVLRPLSLSAMTSLVADCFRAYWSEPPDEVFVAACYEATRGIPALAVALLRELRTEHVKPTAAELCSVEVVTSPAVARSVLLQLAEHPHDVRTVLDAVAVADMPVELETITELTRLASSRVRSALQVLTGIGLFVRDGSVLQLVPFVQRTVYQEVEPKRRTKMHLRATVFLRESGADLDQTAEHLLAVEPGGRQWVADELAQAGRAALRRGLPRQAVRYLQRCVAELPSGSGNAPLWLDLVRAEAVLDQRAAVEHFAQAARATARPEEVAEIAVQLSRSVSDLDAKPKLATTLREVATKLPAAARAVRIELRVAAALLTGSRLAHSVADDLRTELGDEIVLTQSDRKGVALVAIADTSSPRRRTAAEIACSLSKVIAVEELASGDPIDSELWARALLALARAGEFERADMLAARSQHESRSRKFEIADAEFLLTLAMSYAMQGLLREAEARAREALWRMQDQFCARRPEAVGCLVGALLDQGRFDEAGDLLSSFAGVEMTGPSAFEGTAVLEQRGRLLAREGRVSEALSDLLLAGARADELGVDNPAVTRWRGEAALLLAQAGRNPEAERLAEQQHELAVAYGAPWIVGSALRVLAVVGSEATRVERLREAVGLLEHSPAKLELATALADLGSALRISGQPLGPARAVLRRAADVAFRHGAGPLVSRIARELRLSGARPRRLALSGPAALTTSERRVVTLAASGLTNADIAGQLYLSEKTIEGHLVRAYRKLGVRSRRELKGSLQDPDAGPMESWAKTESADHESGVHLRRRGAQRATPA